MNAWKRWDRLLNAFSWTVLAVELVYVVVRHFLPPETRGAIDGPVSWIMPVLLAGAVGYITNRLALWYLFRPYEPHLGGRIQGIIPRRKGQMAVSLGRMVGTKLLNPEALVEELKDEARAFVDDSRRLSALREWLQNGLLGHAAEIAAFATPHVEAQVLEVLDGVATAETWNAIWDETVLPRIRNEKARAFVAGKLVDLLRENAGGIIARIRAELRTFLHARLEEKLPFGLGADAITDYVMSSFADPASMRTLLDGWLVRGETREMLRGKLLEYADRLTVWMKGDEGRAVMGGVVAELKARGRRFLAGYIRERIPHFIDRAFASEFLREKLDRVVLPGLGDRLVRLIGENRQAILDKLRLEQRVAEAVEGMSVATFHETLADFMAENFCAVQVLGFVLGAAVGALQLLAR